MILPVLGLRPALGDVRESPKLSNSTEESVGRTANPPKSRCTSIKSPDKCKADRNRLLALPPSKSLVASQSTSNNRMGSDDTAKPRTTHLGDVRESPKLSDNTGESVGRTTNPPKSRRTSLKSPDKSKADRNRLLALPPSKNEMDSAFDAELLSYKGRVEAASGYTLASGEMEPVLPQEDVSLAALEPTHSTSIPSRTTTHKNLSSKASGEIEPVLSQEDVSLAALEPTPAPTIPSRTTTCLNLSSKDDGLLITEKWKTTLPVVDQEWISKKFFVQGTRVYKGGRGAKFDFDRVSKLWYDPPQPSISSGN